MNVLMPGTKYNRLTYVAPSAKREQDKHLMGQWLCECGKSKSIALSRVVKGYSKSCGCAILEAKPGLTHGKKGTGSYSSWQSMKYRCETPSSKDFPRYGGSGIRVCPEWMDFEVFYRDMGERPKGTTIDRIDGTKGYEPGNCRWAKPIVQGRNNKRFTVVRTPIGVMPLVDYAKHIGISNGAAHLRLKRKKLEGCELYESD